LMYRILLVVMSQLLLLSPVQAYQSDISIHLRGVVMPAQNIKLSFAQAGVVRYVAPGGSVVHEGEIIATLDDKKARAQLAQSEAQYRSAQSELASAQHSRDKSARLVEEDILSNVALVEAEFSVVLAKEKLAVARAQLDIAEDALVDCMVKAPFTGAVILTNINVGEWANPGDPFLEFVNFHQLSLAIDIPPAMAISLTPGLSTLVFDENKPVGKAQVKTVYPVIDPASGLLRVIWEVIPDKGILLSGRYVSLADWESK